MDLGNYDQNVTSFVMMYYVWRKKSLTRKMSARGRRYWAHPMLLKRPSEGFFALQYADLRRYPPKFFNFTRMTITTFDYLLEKLHPRLYRTNTDMRLAVPPEERLLITLRFLASGVSYTSLSHFFLLGISTISVIVHETCEAIWEELRSSAMPVPDATMWQEIATGFWKKTQFPNCVGALDGKHVRIQMPPGSGSQFFNYKKYFSLVLMAICDSNYKFIAVDIGAYGSNADARIFSSSVMGRRILEGHFNFPADQPLPSTVGPDLPHVLVADEAFGLSHHVLRPYARQNLTTPKKIFNYRLSRARRLIECTFGILSGKWRIFHSAIQLSVENAQLAIQACCVLHNVIREKEGISVEEEDEVDLPSVRFTGLRPNNSAITMRDNFTNFFMSPEGEVPWQYQYV
ncbi:putative nuclease HARBI1 [Rana temporaria]|uniref:putative nuclease HARBI1 n=1 Tax=Rana temporaria TaxID=8407 RepID=UPI001AAC6370|nr:putative nuclease HARBI1 [Rana temporaria]XP_040186174.1 putative nuclease HARBI1 [Rana temporaria]XP_040188353.1 putative nuclease HARBI1 [Rana temporaria]XP_040205203.1 putative nuclease HARBI1 [Rana temporaria]